MPVVGEAAFGLVELAGAFRPNLRSGAIDQAKDDVMQEVRKAADRDRRDADRTAPDRGGRRRVPGGRSAADVEGEAPIKGEFGCGDRI
jgi:hypothetical protein